METQQRDLTDKISLAFVYSALLSVRTSIFLSTSSTDFNASFPIYLLGVLTVCAVYTEDRECRYKSRQTRERIAKFGAKTQHLLYPVNVMTRHLEQG